MAIIKKSYNDHNTLRGALREASKARQSRIKGDGRQCSKCENIMPLDRKQAQCGKLRSQKLW